LFHLREVQELGDAKYDLHSHIRPSCRL